MVKIKIQGMLKRFVIAGIAVAALLLVNYDSAFAQPGSAMTVSRLRCEYKTDPLGIDEASPRLSWVLESNQRGQTQTAYRILVSSSRDHLDLNQGDLWDTGKVASDATIQIPYQGKSLKSGRQCFWKVMVWDRDGKPSNWSAPVFWSMGLLSESDWSAQWIGLDLPWQKVSRRLYQALTFLPTLTGSQGKIYLPTPYLRKTFQLDKPVQRATVYVTALGLYELHMNGRRVGSDYFTPGWTDYNKRVLYQTYDVTSLLVPENTNVIGAILSDGWYAGNVAGRGQRFYGSKLRLRLQMEIEYVDGTTQRVVSDASWLASHGPIREADIQAGETYDARLEMPGWSDAGFDDKNWKPVAVGSEPTGRVLAYPGIPVRKMMEMRPVSLNEPKPGVFVYDLGQNFAGWARLKVSGKAGDKVVMRFAERLNPDGTIYTANLRTARVTDTYILKGNGEEIWEPRFTYHGFQYVEVAGFPGKPGLDAITGVALYNDLRAAGSFETSSALINQIYSNLLWGQRSNYFEVPTDCPQRDERAGWMGDAQVFIRTAAYNMNVAPFFTKWMDDVEDAQGPEGNFRDTSPAIFTGTAAAWGDAGVICPWTIWKFYGDTRMIEKHYNAMSKWMDFLNRRSPDYLSPALGAYGDWLNIADPTPVDLISTAYFGYDAKLMSEMARAAGKPADAGKYSTLYREVGAAFTKNFVGADGRLKGDSQTGYLMALKFGLVPDGQRPALGKRLVSLIQARDNYLSTGFLGVSLLMPALTELGRTDLAYILLNNTGFPSWGYEIKLGATTVWERWNGYTEDKGFYNPSMNSFNHYSFGSVGEWMFSELAGIDTDGPGFKRIMIHPHPDGDLTWAKASYDSIRGPIAVSWKIEGQDFVLDLSIPANTTATIFIPASSPDQVLERGLPAQKSPGVRFLKLDSGNALFEIGSGSYNFVSKNAGAN